MSVASQTVFRASACCQGWIAARIHQELTAAFGSEPLVLVIPYRESIQADDAGAAAVQAGGPGEQRLGEGGVVGVGGGQQEEEGQPAGAAEQGVDPEAAQEAAGVLGGGVADRGASIRVPHSFVNNGYKGYLEDRRPNSQGDPYQIASQVLKTIATVPTDAKAAA